jgi:hypothetical protein
MNHASDSREVERPSRTRSPSFPFISLPKALERVRALFEVAGHREVSFEELATAWNYGIHSSGALQTIGALGQFGLLESRGPSRARRFRLTPEALCLVEEPDPGSESYRTALRRTALRPKVFSELAHQFSGKGLTDAALIHYLVQGRREIGELPFTEQGAKDVVGRLKETFGFAGIDLDRPSDKSEASLSPTATDQPPTLPAVQDHSDRPGSNTSPALAEGERLLLGGELGADSYYRVIIRGKFGATEIESLMRQLQIVKEHSEKKERINLEERNGA